MLRSPFSVAGVQRLLDEEGRCLDEGTEKRIRGVATQLLDYVQQNICPRIALEEMARHGSTAWMKYYLASADVGPRKVQQVPRLWQPPRASSRQRTTAKGTAQGRARSAPQYANPMIGPKTQNGVSLIVVPAYVQMPVVVYDPHS